MNDDYTKALDRGNKAVIETMLLDKAEREYKGFWRNMWFLKDGRTGFPPHLFSSKSEAILIAEGGWRSLNPELPLLPNNAAVFGGGTIYPSDISHFIPMPVGDK